MRKITIERERTEDSALIQRYYYDDCKYDLKEGDIIFTNRVTHVVRVLSIDGIIGLNETAIPNLLEITIFSINGKSTIGYKNNMMERTVKISIDQARCWFNGNNKALRELALTVYSEQELSLSYDSIKLEIGDNKLTTSCLTVPYDEADKIMVNTKLSVIAKYFNGNWKRTPYNKGYFIGKSKQGFTTSRDMGDCLGICVHETVIYAGIVYFRDEESAIKAFKMLTELDKVCLFG